MYALKDGISAKLSRLFSDSPSSQKLDQDLVANPYAKNGKHSSSILSFILPSAGWFGTTAHDDESTPTDSLSFKWKSRSFSWKAKPLDTQVECGYMQENIEMINSNSGNEENDFIQSPSQNHKSSFSPSENKEPGSGRSTRSSSDIFEDVVSLHSLENSMTNLMDESLFISPYLHQFFESCLPNLVKGCQWVLLYSTVRHGISLRTLIRNSANLSGPCLLVTGDKKGAVFGGLLDCPLEATTKRKYQGTNRSFVFTTIYGEPRLFRPTALGFYTFISVSQLKQKEAIICLVFILIAL